MLMVQVLLHRNLRGTFASCVLLCEREEEAESGFDFLIQFNQLLCFVVSGLAVGQDLAGAEGPVPDQNPDQSGRVVGHTKDPSSSSGDPDSGEVGRPAAPSGTAEQGDRDTDESRHGNQTFRKNLDGQEPW